MDLYQFIVLELLPVFGSGVINFVGNSDIFIEKVRNDEFTFNDSFKFNRREESKSKKILKYLYLFIPGV